MLTLPTTAGEIAKQRLEKYLGELLDKEWDKSIWEFYTFLLEQAKKHKVDCSGFGSFEYQDDETQAQNNIRLLYPERFVSPRIDRRRKRTVQDTAIDEPHTHVQ